MEIFIKFFIDGGSEIDMDENWTIYALYEKKKIIILWDLCLCISLIYLLINIVKELVNF